MSIAVPPSAVEKWLYKRGGDNLVAFYYLKCVLNPASITGVAFDGSCPIRGGRGLT